MNENDKPERQTSEWAMISALLILCMTVLAIVWMLTQ